MSRIRPQPLALEHTGTTPEKRTNSPEDQARKSFDALVGASGESAKGAARTLLRFAEDPKFQSAFQALVQSAPPKQRAQLAKRLNALTNAHQAFYRAVSTPSPMERDDTDIVTPAQHLDRTATETEGVSTSQQALLAVTRYITEPNPDRAERARSQLEALTDVEQQRVWNRVLDNPKLPKNARGRVSLTELVPQNPTQAGRWFDALAAGHPYQLADAYEHTPEVQGSYLNLIAGLPPERGAEELKRLLSKSSSQTDLEILSAAFAHGPTLRAAVLNLIATTRSSESAYRSLSKFATNLSQNPEQFGLQTRDNPNGDIDWSGFPWRPFLGKLWAADKGNYERTLMALFTALPQDAQHDVILASGERRRSALFRYVDELFVALPDRSAFLADPRLAASGLDFTKLTGTNDQARRILRQDLKDLDFSGRATYLFKRVTSDGIRKGTSRQLIETFFAPTMQVRNASLLNGSIYAEKADLAKRYAVALMGLLQKAQQEGELPPDQRRALSQAKGTEQAQLTALHRLGAETLNELYQRGHALLLAESGIETLERRSLPSPEALAACTQGGFEVWLDPTEDRAPNPNPNGPTPGSAWNSRKDRLTTNTSDNARQLETIYGKDLAREGAHYSEVAGWYAQDKRGEQWERLLEGLSPPRSREDREADVQAAATKLAQAEHTYERNRDSDDRVNLELARREHDHAVRALERLDRLGTSQPGLLEQAVPDAKARASLLQQAQFHVARYYDAIRGTEETTELTRQNNGGPDDASGSGLLVRATRTVFENANLFEPPTVWTRGLPNYSALSVGSVAQEPHITDDAVDVDYLEIHQRIESSTQERVSAYEDVAQRIQTVEQLIHEARSESELGGVRAESITTSEILRKLGEVRTLLLDKHALLKADLEQAAHIEALAMLATTSETQSQARRLLDKRYSVTVDGAEQSLSFEDIISRGWVGRLSEEELGEIAKAVNALRAAQSQVAQEIRIATFGTAIQGGTGQQVFLRARSATLVQFGMQVGQPIANAWYGANGQVGQLEGMERMWGFTLPRPAEPLSPPAAVLTLAQLSELESRLSTSLVEAETRARLMPDANRYLDQYGLPVLKESVGPRAKGSDSTLHAWRAGPSEHDAVLHARFTQLARAAGLEISLPEHASPALRMEMVLNAFRARSEAGLLARQNGVTSLVALLEQGAPGLRTLAEHLNFPIDDNRLSADPDYRADTTARLAQRAEAADLLALGEVLFGPDTIDASKLSSDPTYLGAQRERVLSRASVVELEGFTKIHGVEGPALTPEGYLTPEALAVLAPFAGLDSEEIARVSPARHGIIARAAIERIRLANGMVVESLKRVGIPENKLDTTQSAAGHAHNMRIFGSRLIWTSRPLTPEDVAHFIQLASGSVPKKPSEATRRVLDILGTRSIRDHAWAIADVMEAFLGDSKKAFTFDDVIRLARSLETDYDRNGDHEAVDRARIDFIRKAQNVVALLTELEGDALVPSEAFLTLKHLAQSDSITPEAVDKLWSLLCSGTEKQSSALFQRGFFSVALLQNSDALAAELARESPDKDTVLSLISQTSDGRELTTRERLAIGILFERATDKSLQDTINERWSADFWEFFQTADVSVGAQLAHAVGAQAVSDLTASDWFTLEVPAQGADGEWKWRGIHLVDERAEFGLTETGNDMPGVSAYSRGLARFLWEKDPALKEAAQKRGWAIETISLEQVELLRDSSEYFASDFQLYWSVSRTYKEGREALAALIHANQSGDLDAGKKAWTDYRKAQAGLRELTQNAHVQAVTEEQRRVEVAQLARAFGVEAGKPQELAGAFATYMTEQFQRYDKARADSPFWNAVMGFVGDVATLGSTNFTLHAVTSNSGLTNAIERWNTEGKTPQIDTEKVSLADLSRLIASGSYKPGDRSGRFLDDQEAYQLEFMLHAISHYHDAQTALAEFVQLDNTTRPDPRTRADAWNRFKRAQAELITLDRRYTAGEVAGDVAWEKDFQTTKGAAINISATIAALLTGPMSGGMSLAAAGRLMLGFGLRRGAAAAGARLTFGAFAKGALGGVVTGSAVGAGFDNLAGRDVAWVGNARTAGMASGMALLPMGTTMALEAQAARVATGWWGRMGGNTMLRALTQTGIGQRAVAGTIGAVMDTIGYHTGESGGDKDRGHGVGRFGVAFLTAFTWGRGVRNPLIDVSGDIAMATFDEVAFNTLSGKGAFYDLAGIPMAALNMSLVRGATARMQSAQGMRGGIAIHELPKDVRQPVIRMKMAEARAHDVAAQMRRSGATPERVQRLGELLADVDRSRSQMLQAADGHPRISGDDSESIRQNYGQENGDLAVLRTVTETQGDPNAALARLQNYQDDLAVVHRLTPTLTVYDRALVQTKKGETLTRGEQRALDNPTLKQAAERRDAAMRRAQTAMAEAQTELMISRLNRLGGDSETDQEAFNAWMQGDHIAREVSDADPALAEAVARANAGRTAEQQLNAANLTLADIQVLMQAGYKPNTQAADILYHRQCDLRAAQNLVAQFLELETPPRFDAAVYDQMVTLHRMGLSGATLAGLSPQGRAALLHSEAGQRGIDALYRDPPQYDARLNDEGVPVYRVTEDGPERRMSGERWQSHSQTTWNRLRDSESPQVVAALRQDLRPSNSRQDWLRIIAQTGRAGDAGTLALQRRRESRFVRSILRDMDTPSDPGAARESTGFDWHVAATSRRPNMERVVQAYQEQWRAYATRFNEGFINRRGVRVYLPSRAAGVKLDPDNPPGMTSAPFADMKAFRDAIHRNTVVVNSKIFDPGEGGSAAIGTRGARSGTDAHSHITLGRRADGRSDLDLIEEFYHHGRNYREPLLHQGDANVAAHNLREEILPKLFGWLGTDPDRIRGFIQNPESLRAWIEERRQSYARICGEDCFGAPESTDIVFRDIQRALSTGDVNAQIGNLAVELRNGFHPFKTEGGRTIVAPNPRNNDPGVGSQRTARSDGEESPRSALAAQLLQEHEARLRRSGQLLEPDTVGQFRTRTYAPQEAEAPFAMGVAWGALTTPELRARGVAAAEASFGNWLEHASTRHSALTSEVARLEAEYNQLREQALEGEPLPAERARTIMALQRAEDAVRAAYQRLGAYEEVIAAGTNRFRELVAGFEVRDARLDTAPALLERAGKLRGRAPDIQTIHTSDLPRHPFEQDPAALYTALLRGDPEAQQVIARDPGFVMVRALGERDTVIGSGGVPDVWTDLVFLHGDPAQKVRMPFLADLDEASIATPAGRAQTASNLDDAYRHWGDTVGENIETLVARRDAINAERNALIQRMRDTRLGGSILLPELQRLTQELDRVSLDIQHAEATLTTGAAHYRSLADRCGAQPDTSLTDGYLATLESTPAPNRSAPAEDKSDTWTRVWSTGNAKPLVATLARLPDAPKGKTKVHGVSGRGLGTSYKPGSESEHVAHLRGVVAKLAGEREAIERSCNQLALRVAELQCEIEGIRESLRLLAQSEAPIPASLQDRLTGLERRIEETTRARSETTSQWTLLARAAVADFEIMERCWSTWCSENNHFEIKYSEYAREVSSLRDDMNAIRRFEHELSSASFNLTKTEQWDGIQEELQGLVAEVTASLRQREAREAAEAMKPDIEAKHEVYKRAKEACDPLEARLDEALTKARAVRSGYEVAAAWTEAREAFDAYRAAMNDVVDADAKLSAAKQQYHAAKSHAGDDGTDHWVQATIHEHNSSASTLESRTKSYVDAMNRVNAIRAKNDITRELVPEQAEALAERMITAYQEAEGLYQQQNAFTELELRSYSDQAVTALGAAFTPERVARLTEGLNDREREHLAGRLPTPVARAVRGEPDPSTVTLDDLLAETARQKREQDPDVDDILGSGRSARSDGDETPALPDKPELITPQEMRKLKEDVYVNFKERAAENALDVYVDEWNAYLTALHMTGRSKAYHSQVARARTMLRNALNHAPPLTEREIDNRFKGKRPTVSIYPAPTGGVLAIAKTQGVEDSVKASELASPELVALWNKAVVAGMTPEQADSLAQSIGKAWTNNPGFAVSPSKIPPGQSNSLAKQFESLMGELKKQSAERAKAARLAAAREAGAALDIPNGIGGHAFLNDEGARTGFALGNQARTSRGYGDQNPLSTNTPLLSSEPMGEGLPSSAEAYRVWYESATPEQRRIGVRHLVEKHEGDPIAFDGPPSFWFLGDDESATTAFLANARSYHRRTSQEETYSLGGLDVPARVKLTSRQESKLESYRDKQLLDEEGTRIFNVWARGASAKQIGDFLMTLEVLYFNGPIPWSNVANHHGNPLKGAEGQRVRDDADHDSLRQGEAERTQRRAADEARANDEQAAQESAEGVVHAFNSGLTSTVGRLMEQAGRTIRFSESPLVVRAPGAKSNNARASFTYPNKIEIGARIEAVIQNTPTGRQGDVEALLAAAMQSPHDAATLGRLLKAANESGLFADAGRIQTRGQALFDSPNPELSIALMQDPRVHRSVPKTEQDAWTFILRIDGTDVDTAFPTANAIARGQALVQAGLLTAARFQSNMRNTATSTMHHAFEGACKKLQLPEELATALWETEDIGGQALLALASDNNLYTLRDAAKRLGDTGVDVYEVLGNLAARDSSNFANHLPGVFDPSRTMSMLTGAGYETGDLKAAQAAGCLFDVWRAHFEAVGAADESQTHMQNATARTTDGSPQREALERLTASVTANQRRPSNASQGQ